MQLTMDTIGHVETDLPEKFGVPRQSGLVEALTGRIVFDPPYRRQEALREIEGFSHLWVLWVFSASVGQPWHFTVRPPRLGGNRRVGVFASRAPFRPNPIGLSCVRLLGVDRNAPDGPCLLVAGVDMTDGTPVLDVKPYVPVTDCRPQAEQGYTRTTRLHALTVVLPQPRPACLPADKEQALRGLLASDPRPGYEDDPEKVYGMTFAGLQITFRVENGCVQVLQIRPLT